MIGERAKRVPRGDFHELPVMDRYRGAPWGTRLFLFLRWRLTPYGEMASHLPPNGLIFDLGCGHGLFSMELVRTSPARRVVGFDLDPERIRIARKACAGVENLLFEDAALSPLEGRTQRLGRPDAISMIDVLHYLEPRDQESLLAQAWRVLPDHGVLIVREVSPERGWISKWNRLYEKIATRIGSTPAMTGAHFFRTRDQWLRLLTAAGFRARALRCSSFLFADVLFIGEKAAVPARPE
ncbi:MAG: class I SAM-dependent methyltransferase [Elusimicrobiota bacterium]